MRWVHDVCTDPADPPPFVALRDVRLNCANGAAYNGYTADEHRRHYPDLVTAEFSHSTAVVFATALAIVRKHHWDIAATNAAEGRIEATAATRIFHFKDDVVMRIRAQGSGAQIDVRSKSRMGESDLGANARRTRGFLVELNNRIYSVRGKR